ncbi:flavodoxin family protein [Allobaculum mucilyticum]|uniref:flavodoxin family protein n=1 Tax=Allobaculum mucilyticum TaxID=2834459 RepID=UPI001E637F43|nr:flavodoxin family protein [Allobaculum mucilyticum]UNT96424.1 flavodoxin family protein [Allobaculum mucilyticum]
MKKIVVINSSPRENGNCDLLCSEFIRGASADPENRIVRVNLKDQNFDFYREEQETDDADVLAGELKDSNVIVLATPVYFYTMSGMMKTFIDRMTPYFSDFAGKDFYYFLTAAINRSEMEAAVESLNGFTDSIPDSNVIRVIYGSNVVTKGDIIDHPTYREVYELGLNLR